MTIVVVILVGAGTLLIASALDCTPIVTTFQKIVSGQSVDWSGMANQCGQSVTNQQLSPADQAKIKQNAGGVSPDSQGKCPSGYTNLGGVCIPQSVLGQI